MISFIRRIFSVSLTIQMIVATLLGIACGLVFGDLCSVFEPWGNAYILILKITTIPYLISAIIHGIGRLSSSIGKEILQKGLLFIGSAWVINIAMIYCAVFLFPTTEGEPFTSFSSLKPTQLNFAELLIPDNIFYALANNTIPAIVIFGLILGIALMHIKEKQAFMAIWETLVDALTRITGWIARITPIGTFLIIATQAGTIQPSTVKQVGTYLVLYILIICTIVFWIFPRLVQTLTAIPATRWIRDLFPILVLAYTTNVVIVTLPFIIELVKRETEVFYKQDGRIKDQIQGIVSVIFNLPLGSLFISLFIFFVAVFYHMPLAVPSQIQLFLTSFLTSLGAVGLGSWINSLNFLLDSLGLPLDAVSLYLSIMPFTAGFQSMISVIEIASLSLLVALACHGLIQWRIRKLVKGLAFTFAPVAVGVLLLKPFNPLPPISNPHVSIYAIDLRPPIAVEVFRPGDPLPSGRGGDAFDRIFRSKVLRVGYNAEAVPFSFDNKAGRLSGYDVSFAYQLAYDLGCSLQFIPMQYAKLAEELGRGLYDIGMSGISITEERLKTVSFTNPYLDNQVVFVMKKKYKKTLSSVAAILERPEVSVAVLKGSSYEALAHALFPKEQILLLDSYDQFAAHSSKAVLIRGEPQAISWSLRYPQFTVVAPTPEIGQDSLAYAVRPGSDRWLQFLNQWLRLKKNDEFTQLQYDLWILGKTEIAIPDEPRWSVLKDVLHVVD